MLIDAGSDALIPDPTGIIIALRTTYSIGKVAYKYNENIETKIKCETIRMDGLYETVIASFIYFEV